MRSPGYGKAATHQAGHPWALGHRSLLQMAREGGSEASTRGAPMAPPCFQDTVELLALRALLLEGEFTIFKIRAVCQKH